MLAGSVAIAVFVPTASQKEDDLRKTIRGSLDKLIATLIDLGYRQDHQREYSFRKGRLHIIVRPRHGKTELSLHKDYEFHIKPARRSGEDLKEEFRKIIVEMKKRE